MDMPGAGDAGENDAVAFIKAHPDWRLEDKKRLRSKGRGTSMFKELLPLLEGRTMILTAAKIGDALTVTIYPKRNGEKDENPVGNTPLCVTGTAEELDHELPGLIAGYAEELGKFHSNLGQIKQQLADAATAVAEAAKVKTARKPATAPAKPAAKPAEPPVAGPDLFTASMPAAAVAPETPPAQADAADGTAVIRTDPAVVQPPVPSGAATQPRKRATPIRGKAVETPPLPGTTAAPIPALAGDPICMASGEDDSEPEAVTPAKPAESVQAATQEMGWGDEDDTTLVEVAAEDAGDDDDDDSCPF
jgi:PRTRC genetic system protein E